MWSSLAVFSLVGGSVSTSETLGSTLRRFVKKWPEAGQVSVPWQVFGSSGHSRMPRCVVPSFTLRMDYDFG